MLVVVIVLVDASLHLFGDEIDRNQWYFVERSLGWRTPQGTFGCLQHPVAERNDNIIKLQTLTLVNRDEAYAIERIAMYAFLVQRIVPFLDKRVYIATVVLQVSSHLIVEGADISTLTLHLLYGI